MRISGDIELGRPSYGISSPALILSKAVARLRSKPTRRPLPSEFLRGREFELKGIRGVLLEERLIELLSVSSRRRGRCRRDRRSMMAAHATGYEPG